MGKLYLILTNHEKFCRVEVTDKPQSEFDILFKEQEFRVDPKEYKIYSGDDYYLKKAKYECEKYCYDSETPVTGSMQLEVDFSPSVVGYPVNLYKKFIEIIDRSIQRFNKIKLVDDMKFTRKVFQSTKTYDKAYLLRFFEDQYQDLARYLIDTNIKVIKLSVLRELLGKQYHEYQLKDAIHTVNKMKRRGLSLRVESNTGKYYDYLGDTPKEGNIYDEERNLSDNS